MRTVIHRIGLITAFLASCALRVLGQQPCDFPVTTNIRVLLEGPLDSISGLMNDELRVQGLLPLSEPYSALGYQYRGGGGETMDPAILLAEGPDAIVDWLVVEVRYANDPGRLFLSRAALLQRDGDVVGMDGLNGVGLCVEPGKYNIAVRHRNHLGIMTGRPVEFYQGQFGLIFVDLIDLTSPATAAYRDSEARRRIGSTMAMWSGDVTFDGRVQYTGLGNDRDAVLQAIGGTIPTNTANGYGPTDLNLDGSTRYTGQSNDRDQILRTIGGVVPTNIREGYIPKDSLTLRPNVHIVDPLAWELDTALSAMTTRDTLVFQVNSTMEGIDTGHVVVGGEYGGYLRRVMAVDSSGTMLSLVTEQGSFYDLFASGTLTLETPLNTTPQPFAAFDAMSSAGGVDIVFPGNGCVQGGLEDMDITLNGSLQQIGEFTSTPLGDVCSWAFNGSIRMNGKLSLGIGACGAPIEEEILLTAPVPFAANVPVPVAPGVIVLIPIAGTFEINGIVGLEVMTGTSFGFNNTFNLDINGRVGVDFDHGLPRPIMEMTTSSPGFEQLDVAFGTSHAECELTAGIKVGVELYKVAGPYLSFVGSHAIELNASQTTDDKDIEYKNTYKLIPGLEAELWEKFDVTFEIESPTIVEYAWPGKLELMSDSLPLGPEENELDDPIQVRVSGKLEILGQDIPMPPASNVPVSFNVLNGGGYILEEGVPVLTDALGIAEAHWTLGTVDEGEQVAQARVLTGTMEDIEEDSPLQLFAEIESFRMEIVSGDEQIGSVNSPLLNPLVVRITNQLDIPVEAYPVHFEVHEGNGTISDDFLPTSSEGLAATNFTLGSDAAGQHMVKAYALTNQGDTLEGAPVYFKAYIDPDTLMYAALSGNLQTGPASTVLPVDLRVQVNSVLGQEPQEDVLVYFEVISGGGSVSSFGTSTNSDGIASVAYTLGPDLSVRQKVKAWAIDVYGDTLRGGPLEFEACTIICPPTATDIDGNVYNVVKIGCDCWFQRNLRTHTFANGDPIPFHSISTILPDLSTPEDSDWSPEESPVFHEPYMTEYEGTASHDGPVYNGPAAVDPRGICPSGWHISTHEEWRRISIHLGIPPLPPPFAQYWDTSHPFADHLRSVAEWPIDIGSNNSTGFTAIPSPIISNLIYSPWQYTNGGYRITFTEPSETGWQYAAFFSGVRSGYVYNALHGQPNWMLEGSNSVGAIGPETGFFQSCRCVLD